MYAIEESILSISKDKNDSNMLDFILTMSMNSINYITTSIKDEDIPHLIEIKSKTGSTLTMDDINKFLISAEHRQLLFDNGVDAGKNFIETHRSLNKKDDKKDDKKDEDKKDEPI